MSNPTPNGSPARADLQSVHPLLPLVRKRGGADQAFVTRIINTSLLLFERASTLPRIKAL